MKSINVELVQVSIYSVNPDIHDRITKKKGSLVKSLSAIKHLQDVGINVQIACPVMQQNKDDVVNVMKYAKENGLRLRTNSCILPAIDGDDSFLKSSALSLEQKRSMLCDMMEADWTYTKDVLLESKDNGDELYKDSKEFLNSNLCGACINSCAVSLDGNVCPCPEWPSYKMGNIYNQKLSEIWYNNPLMSVIRRINKQKNFPECLSCKAIDFCKRCLKLNEQTNRGIMLFLNRENCEYAWMVKEVLEKYDVNND
jgi:radical SAM protein with 4Fe4S-binding SPASM domain